MKNLRIYSKKFKVDKKEIHHLVAFLIEELELDFQCLEVNFVSVDQIVKVNSQFLSHNYPTDIITFGYTESGNTIDAEIFICYDIAIENSKRFRDKPEAEILRLIIHGILHLSGFDDKNISQKKKMKSKETYFLKKFLKNK